MLELLLQYNANNLSTFMNTATFRRQLEHFKPGANHTFG